MADLLDLYDLAEIHNIGVYWFDLGAAESLSLQMEDGSCAIAMDPWRLPTVADETVKLAHELGHCQTGSFYHKLTPLQTRERCEWRAEKWAILQLLPLSDIDRCVRQGYTEPWEISEQLDVPESLVRKALAYYQEQNL